MQLRYDLIGPVSKSGLAMLLISDSLSVVTHTYATEGRVIRSRNRLFYAMETGVKLVIHKLSHV